MQANDREQLLAKIVSWTFHPLWVPILALILLFQLDTISVYIIPDKARYLILLMVFLGSLAFPALVMMLFVRKGLLSSLYMEKREERLYPFLLMMVLYYILYLLFGSINLPFLVNGLFLSVSVVILVVMIINIWWKLSIHTSALGGITGIFTAIAIKYSLDLLWLICVCILISGLVGWARLKLDAHKPAQVYVGFLVGIVITMILYFLF